MRTVITVTYNVGMLGDTLSNWLSPNGGVPQGTLSGPLHYQIMSKDFSIILPVVKYVDDSSIDDVILRGQCSLLQLADRRSRNEVGQCQQDYHQCLQS